MDLERDHGRWMREALREAQKAYDAGEVPVGAVVVQEGQVIARSWNQVETLKDATAHAEMLSLTQAESALHLNEQQIVEIEPVFEELIDKYEPDFKLAFSSRDPWYFSSHYSLCTIEGIPRESLNSILIERQIELWDRQYKSRCQSYWTRIERSYQKRTNNRK